MRKIDEAMCAAVKAHQYFKSGNTEVNVRLDMYGHEHIEVRLHDVLLYVVCFPYRSEAYKTLYGYYVTDYMINNRMV